MKVICERAIGAKIRIESELICKISPPKSTNIRKLWWWQWMKIRIEWRSDRISCTKQTASLQAKKLKTNNKLCRLPVHLSMSTNQCPLPFTTPTKLSNFKKKPTANYSKVTQEMISRHLVIKLIGKSIIRSLNDRLGPTNNLLIKSDILKVTLIMMCQSKLSSSNNSHRTLWARYRKL